MSKRKIALLTASVLFGQMANAMWTEDNKGNTCLTTKDTKKHEKISQRIMAGILPALIR